MQNDFVYAIPSYQRADKQITVNYLNKIGVEQKQIYVFVQTKEDKEKYQKTIGDKAVIVLRKASRGVEARNNILNEITKDNILMLDDDVKAIGKLVNGKIKKIETAKSMDAEFNKCFEMCTKLNVHIFGIYPVYNDFYMEHTISTKAPVNTIFGFLKGFHRRYDERYDTKEDAALCAKILASGEKILRFNFLAVDADHRKTKNGYIDEWHQKENIRCVKQLLAEFPMIYKSQKDKPWEVRTILNDKKIRRKNNGNQNRKN